MRLTASAACGVLLALGVGCTPAIKSTADGPLTARQLAELWSAPNDLARRDLFWGPWGKAFAPNAGHVFRVVEEDAAGFSAGAALEDENGREWSVKLGPEAHTEVVVSRILSALGYHQPPVYFVEQWTQRGGKGPAEQKAGRFRPKDIGLKDKGSWSWQENPFVDTPPYRGLLALMMLLNGTDLKNDNNTLYEVSDTIKNAPRAARRRGVQQWYVVRDVGAALGETGKLEPTRGDPFVFAKAPFITGVSNGFVRFDYRGRHQELIEQITAADVRWMVRLASRLSDEQWRDAFRAGGYGPAASEMFITRIKEKLSEADIMTTAVLRPSSAPPANRPAAGPE